MRLCRMQLRSQSTDTRQRNIARSLDDPNLILLHLSGTGSFVDHSNLGTYIAHEHHFNDRNLDQGRKIDASYPPNGASNGLILVATAKD